MRSIIFFLFLVQSVWLQAGIFSNKTHFLKSEEAFRFSPELIQQDKSAVNLHWDIEDGYYLYQKEIRVVAQGAELASIQFPSAELHQDEFFGEVNIFRNQLDLPIKLSNIAENATLEISYQGCTKGFCYPPEIRQVSLATLLATQDSASANRTKTTALSGMPSSILSAHEVFAEKLLNSHYAVFVFFLLGIGLAFTPCVLPMLPLLSAIVIGGAERPNNLRAFALSITYVQGMALTYSLLGLLVAFIGLPFQIALQSPYVIIALSLIFVLLSLSMFGLFNLQLPTRLQTKLTLISQQQKSGAFSGVFIMGMLAGLVATPCTSAPLSGALLYVAQSGNLFIGATALYLLALGMGLPLILITVFGNKILPKSGAWMERVKIGFGFVMLALPVFLLSRILPEAWEYYLWLILGGSFLVWLFKQMPKTTIGKVMKGICIIGIIGLLVPIFYETSVFSESKKTDALTKSHLAVDFQQVASYEELQQKLQANPKAVAMLDLYADWCVACKEFEKYTFTDTRVQQHFSQILLLRADMSRNSDENSELLEKLNVVGLPTIIFFDQQGKEIAHSRVTGFMPAEEFEPWLKKIILP